jgi:hypothetical protein
VVPARVDLADGNDAWVPYLRAVLLTKGGAGDGVHAAVAVYTGRE